MSVKSPHLILLNNAGNALTNGKVYIGEANKDPETYPVDVYWDIGFNKKAEQPIRTTNGIPVYAGSPGRLFIEDASYSITVRDEYDVLVYSVANENSYEITTGDDFDSTTNSSEYPDNVDNGFLRKCTETFNLGATSGSHYIYDGDYILANKRNAESADADWDILLGINSRVAKHADSSAKNLLINVTGNDTATITADRMIFVNSAGDTRVVNGVSETLTLSTHKIGTELASHWYQIWFSVTENEGTITIKAAPDLSSTADADVLNSLSDSAATFQTYGVAAGDELFNTTDNTKGYVKAVSSETVLTCMDADGNDLDLFPDGNENYVIHMLSPTGIGTYKANIGAVYNDAGSDLDYMRKEGNLVSLTTSTLYSGAGAASYTERNALTIIPVTAVSAYGYTNPSRAADNNIYIYLASTADPYVEKYHYFANNGMGAGTIYQSTEFYLPIINKGKIYSSSSSGITERIYITNYEE